VAHSDIEFQMMNVTAIRITEKRRQDSQEFQDCLIFTTQARLNDSSLSILRSVFILFSLVAVT
jgi:hypothetical protein